MTTSKNSLHGLNYIDLFAGIGGFRQAIDPLGATCVFSSEWDKHAQQTYFDNYGVIPDGDITKVDEKDIPSHDILVGGFPCQAFSISGNGFGFKDTRGTLFFDIVRIAKHHQPKMMILENVKNIASHDNGNTLKVILQSLDEIGYNVFHEVLNSSHFGIAQKRERCFFVCFRKDLNIKSFTFPKGSKKPIFIKDITLSDEETEQYTLKRNDITLDQEKIKAFDYLPPEKRLKSLRIGTINKGGQGERIYSENGHGITLSAYGGGAAGKTGAFLINGKVRKLAPRECARIQGFPDSFIINPSDSQAWKQFGNSIPVPVVKEILHTIIEDSHIFNSLSVSN